MLTANPQRSAFVSAMRKVPSAVAVVSMKYAGCRGGLTATAVCSVSADPPQILVCVNKAGRAHSAISSAERFAVNFLAQNQDGIARDFSDPKAQPEEKFSGGKWIAGASEVPLLEDALVAFECHLVQSMDCGTHTIFVGQITEVHQRDELALVYKSGEFLAA
ncbi:flavin reductase (NADH) [Variovorax sp. YR266]|uniref:flavin reductase family protein n=1 Tax=Variovorax sp. YR266 TaxID=1884386 RepID=UPI00089464A6|nr:flavin reductase family protein [Variovorax sp. YR266]SDY34982.1 flavin reductase (NADH) [Variovorax sp. YR266]